MTKLIQIDPYDLPPILTKDSRVSETFQEMFREAERKRKATSDRRFKLAVWLGTALYCALFWWAVARAVDKGF